MPFAIDTLLFTGGRILLILVLGLAAQYLIRFVAKQLAQRVVVPNLNHERRSRLLTLISAGKSVAYIVVYLTVALTLLSELGIDIAPFLAGAGLAGLALSLGTQTLIRDYLGGLLILTENQFTVGDVVTIGNFSGEVERITLRVTYLRDNEGRQHILANGDIRAVSNLTARWSQAVVTLNIPARSDMQDVQQALESALERVKVDPDVKADLLEAPRAATWVGLVGSAVQVQLIAKTAPGRQWAVMTAMRRYSMEALRAVNVKGVTGDLK